MTGDEDDRDLTRDLPFVMGDERALQQLILSLIQNAVDAMSAASADRDRTLRVATGRMRLGEFVRSFALRRFSRKP
jgi:C4-dicarboxylate-specific signal transduction histidine kinase